jgi:excisionase family DNA binding protein
MTVREAARYLRLGRDRVRALIRGGELAATDLGRPGRQRWTIFPEALQKFLAARRVRATPPPPPRGRRPRAGQVDYYPGS